MSGEPASPISAERQHLLQLLQSPVEPESTNQRLQLFRNWSEIINRREIPIEVRMCLEPWRKRFHEQGKNACQMRLKGLDGVAKQQEEQLCSELAEKITEQAAMESDPLKRFSLMDIKRKIEDCLVEDLVSNIIQCFDDEDKLLEKYLKERDSEGMQIDEASSGGGTKDQMITDAQDKVKKIEKHLNEMKKKVASWKQENEDLENEDFKFDGLNRLSQIKKINGSADLNKALEKHRTKKEEIQKNIATNKHTLLEMEKMLQMDVSELKSDMVAIVDTLLADVQCWRSQQQLAYVNMREEPNLDLIASRCGRVGELLWNICFQLLKEWRNLQCDAPFKETSKVDSFTEFYALFCKILQGTFLVTEQDSYVVKTDKKSLPKIVVRILAAEKLDCLTRGRDVTALFCYEQRVNMAYSPERFSLDLKLVEKYSEKLKQGQKKSFTQPKGAKYYQAIFSDLQLDKNKFERDIHVKVHEAKYRLVFVTQVDLDGTDRESLWTMSLPLVVITGAIQNCAALASSIWQCYSTDDVFKMPLKAEENLPWKVVAKILNAKMRRLGNRDLTEEHLRHLGYRLTGESNLHPEREISFQLFCEEKMQNCSFSFWRWFLGIYNLIDKYLKPYWLEGLIEGFIDKDEAKQKLQEHKKNRMFLLRFSDNHLTDSQGIHSMFGAVTGSVLSIKTQGGKKIGVVDSIDPITSKKLHERNLAVILKTSKDKRNDDIYQHLFPGDRTRDEAFKQFYEKGPVVEGYSHAEDYLVIHLEQALCSLDLDEEQRKRKTPSTHSLPSCIQPHVNDAMGNKSLHTTTDPTQPMGQNSAIPSPAKQLDCPELRKRLSIDSRDGYGSAKEMMNRSNPTWFSPRGPPSMESMSDKTADSPGDSHIGSPLGNPYVQSCPDQVNPHQAVNIHEIPATSYQQLSLTSTNICNQQILLSQVPVPKTTQINVATKKIQGFNIGTMSQFQVSTESSKPVFTQAAGKDMHRQTEDCSSSPLHIDEGSSLSSCYSNETSMTDEESLASPKTFVPLTNVMPVEHTSEYVQDIIFQINGACWQYNAVDQSFHQNQFQQQQVGGNLPNLVQLDNTFQETNNGLQYNHDTREQQHTMTERSSSFPYDIGDYLDTQMQLDSGGSQIDTSIFDTIITAE
ncbi:hypothetical protein ACJMK2_040157 [Sinanodonta woodiana]|uniref:Signal transducer and activator of transcription n=1 Tax=Sinanodonta woodiana TaxID=1069815 RepID=A0ABD3WE64_SINWO